MLIPYSATQGYSTLLDRLSATALVELDRLMASVANESPAVQQEALMDLLPVLGDQYVGASSMVSAQFFTELQDLNGVRKPVAPETLDGVGPKRWHALAGWGAGASVFEQGGALLVYSLLSGGLTKILTEAAADTMVGNAAIQGGMRAQRVPRPGCCAFCGMLASRGAAYASEESAGKVVGRGAPIGSHKLAKGVRARGVGKRAREIGEDFHDHCRCRIVTVTEGNQVQLQATADKYYDSYLDAFKKTGEKVERNVISYMTPNGDRHNLYEWVDEAGDVLTDKQRRSTIIAHMRDGLGVK